MGILCLWYALLIIDNTGILTNSIGKRVLTFKHARWTVNTLLAIDNARALHGLVVPDLLRIPICSLYCHRLLTTEHSSHYRSSISHVYLLCAFGLISWHSPSFIYKCSNSDHPPKKERTPNFVIQITNNIDNHIWYNLIHKYAAHCSHNMIVNCNILLVFVF